MTTKLLDYWLVRGTEPPETVRDYCLRKSKGNKNAVRRVQGSGAVVYIAIPVGTANNLHRIGHGVFESELHAWEMHLKRVSRKLKTVEAQLSKLRDQRLAASNAVAEIPYRDSRRASGEL